MKPEAITPAVMKRLETFVEKMFENELISPSVRPPIGSESSGMESTRVTGG